MPDISASKRSLPAENELVGPLHQNNLTGCPHSNREFTEQGQVEISHVSIPVQKERLLMRQCEEPLCLTHCQILGIRPRAQASVVVTALTVKCWSFDLAITSKILETSRTPHQHCKDERSLRRPRQILSQTEHLTSKGFGTDVPSPVSTERFHLQNLLP